MSRARACLLLALAATTPTAVAVSTAEAALPVPGQANAWADFQQPDRWLPQQDNLHWYLQSPEVADEMVGSTLRFVVASPRRIDCDNLTAGYQPDWRWTNVELDVESCTARRLVATVPVDRAMVGQRVSVVGWSAAIDEPASITGRVTALVHTTSDTVSASRTDAPGPLVASAVLGRFQGRKVVLSSDTSVNTLVVGRERFDVPDGGVLHARMDNGVVHVLTEGQFGAVWLWNLDVGSGEVTAAGMGTGSWGWGGYSAAARVSEANEFGFIVERDHGMVRSAWNWHGDQRAYYSARADRLLGLMGDHVGYIEMGQIATTVGITRLSDGATVRGGGGGYLWGAVLDRDAVAIDYGNRRPGTDIVDRCRLTMQGNSCVRGS